MNGLNAWLFWPDSLALSVLAWFVLLSLFLYAARVPAHQIVAAVTHLLAHASRHAARWIQKSAEGLRLRNRAVLLGRGQAEVEARIEREFDRVGELVRRELVEYPALQRKMMDELTRIEEDYQRCGEVPPPSPEWVEALSSVANLKSSAEIAKKILEDLHRSVQKVHDKTIGEYRRAYEERHKILKGLMPVWRSVDKTARHLDTRMVNLDSNAQAIDAHIAQYKEMRAKSDQSEHALSVSAFVQLGISLLIMVIAAGGAFINFKLIALPMSEMVGAGDYITNSLRASDVAALVIVLMEASMGVFLLEAMRITHLFPSIASMNDQLRRRVMWTALVMLVVLAGIESSLALMRDMLIADKAAVMHDLAAAAPAPADGWLTHIPMIGQMVLGFALPFVLAFVAIPLEVVIYSLRTVVGVLLVMLMRAVAFILRFLALIFYRLGRIMVHVYDITIVVPLLLERWVLLLREGAANRKINSRAKEAA